MIRAILMAVLVVLATPAGALMPDEVLSDPVLEERARAISTKVRCVVCQNEAIDTSNASVARDLRLLVRERLVAGDSDSDVYEFLRARYGDFVLFSPPWKPATYALWVGPFLVMAIGLGWALLALRSRRAATTVAALTEEERAALARIVSRDDA